MAKRVKSAIAGAFRSDPELKEFVLQGLTLSGRELGAGSYGSVEEVSPDPTQGGLYLHACMYI
jgi:hypothetical protein